MGLAQDVLALAPIVLLASVILAAGTGLILGVSSLVRRAGLEEHFAGELLILAAWALPEGLITFQACSMPGLGPRRPGEPMLVAWATTGSAAASLLVLGLLSAVRKEGTGLGASGTGASLVSAAVPLLVLVVGFAIGILVPYRTLSPVRPEDDNPSLRRLIGLVILATLLAGVRMVQRTGLSWREKASVPPPDLDASGPRPGAVALALAVAGLSVVALIFLTPPLLDALVSLFRRGDKPGDIQDAGRTLFLSLLIPGLLAIPDAAACLIDRTGRGQEAPRLFLVTAALYTLAFIAPIEFGSMRYDGSGRKAMYGLTVVLIAVMVILLSSVPNRIPERARGCLVAALAMAGYAAASIM